MTIGETLPSGVESATAELIKTGVLGALLVLLGAYAFWVTRQWSQSQKDRVNDQKAVTDTLLKFAESMNGVVRDLKSAVDGLKSTIDGQKASIGTLDAGVTEMNRSLDDHSRILEQLRTSSDESRRQHEKIQEGLQDLLRRGR